MIMLTFVDLNPIDLNYYWLMISLDKSNGICNVVDDLYMKICIPSETKDVNVMEFNMMTRINEVKILIKHILCNCKCKFDSATCTSNQSWNHDKCQC